MTAVASQPISLSRVDITKSPMTSCRLASSIIVTMTGTATTPLMTALQNSAFTGSIGEKFSSAPTTVAIAIAP